MDKEIRILTSLGTSLFITGLGLLVWGGLVLGIIQYGFLGTALSITGLAVLTKKA